MNINENWNTIVNEFEPLIGRNFIDIDGYELKFLELCIQKRIIFGLKSLDKLELLSCVGNFEMYGYRLIPSS